MARLGRTFPVQHHYGRLNPIVIPVTTTQTESGVARIQKTVLQTLSGTARISAISPQTLSGTARITATTLKTLSGTARIQKTVPQTETGVSRITVTSPKTLSGTARITATTLKTESGIANIKATTLRTESGVSRVQKTVPQTESGVARITQTVPKTESGIARITAVTPKTLSGIARITATTLKTETGIASVKNTTLRTETGISRVQITTLKTETAVARITGITLRTETGTANIFNTTVKNETGTARIQKTSTQTETGVSRITIKSLKTLTGTANIFSPRYWVGGTAAWDATAGTKWSTTSGGPGGASVPTTANDVFFDGNSGTGNCTVQTAVATPGSLNCTGYLGTLTQSTNINMGSSTAGDLILGSGMTFVWVSGAIKLSTTKASNTTVDLAGKTIGNLTFNGTGANFVLANDVNCLTFAPSGGGVDLNGFNVVCSNLSNGNTTTRTVNMRGGTITMNGTGAIFDAPAGTLIYAWTAGAKFLISNTSATAKTFAGGTNTTLPKIEVAGASLAGLVTFSGAFTADSLKLNPDANVKFTSGTTEIFTHGLDWVGTTGHPITVQSTTPASAATISVPSGIIAADWLVLKDSAAVGGATFYAGANSVDATGNTGWIFLSAPSTTTQPETGIARIQKTVLQTETGVARIALITVKTLTGTARIFATVARTLSGTARIRVTTTKTETGVARIQLQTLRTLSGVARISVTTPRTESGTARIAVTTLKTETGIASILRTVLKTETGISRIQKIVPQTLTGTARITATTKKTETGTARISKTVLQTESGISRIALITQRTETGIAAIVSPTHQQNLSGTARITNKALKTLTGIARVQKSISASISGTARIEVTTTQLHDITAGMQYYFPLNESSGTTAHDGSGHGNDATLHGSPLPTWVSGPFSQNALQFIGTSNAYAEAADAPNLGSSGAMSISLFVKRGDFSASEQILVSKVGGAVLNYYMDIYQNKVLFAVTGNAWKQSTSTVPNDGSFHHLVVTYDLSNFRFYIDGVLDRTVAVTDTPVPGNAPLRLGAYGDGSLALNGALAQVRMFNRVLTADEVAFINTFGPNGSFRGTARITATTIKTELGHAAILRTVAKTETGTARITHVTQQTESGVAKITATTLKTESGVARITAKAQKTETGVSRITIVTQRTLSGTARITDIDDRSITGTARITATASRSMLGLARITSLVQRTETGIARILTTALKTLSGAARVQKTVLKTLTGLARITAKATKTLSGVARVTGITSKTLSATARITATTRQTMTGTARIAPILRSGKPAVILMNTQTNLLLEAKDNRVELQGGPERVQLGNTGGPVVLKATPQAERIVLN